MSIFSIRASIEQYYPEYYSWNTYPAKDCIAIRKAKEQWGILGNFAQVDVKVDGVKFCCTEQLYQMMKFKDAEPILALYQKRGMQIKMAMKPFVKRGLQRADWDMMIVDAMKFCLQAKYEQNQDFHNVLASTSGKIIVEDQSGFKKSADTWGAKLNGDVYEGSNLLGRLLMELRNAGYLEYNLPNDALDFINILRGK